MRPSRSPVSLFLDFPFKWALISPPFFSRSPWKLLGIFFSFLSLRFHTFLSLSIYLIMLAVSSFAGARVLAVDPCLRKASYRISVCFFRENYITL